ncbi:MAG TPA: glutamate 5-kinase, partial [Geobacteraceae bacterium]
MRSSILKKVKRLVVKIGSRVLTDEDHDLNTTIIGGIALQVAAARLAGKEVVIVTSGAIAAGRNTLGIQGRPRTIPEKQAAA